ncbi:uncharacterized protein JCM6883_002172 [Sporobolomyces salmoneus]|uniref:uncharacterized protein n=1 Tax=Sporobolomyces salmoneus TaxID=183962 RepID=UPI00317CC6C2
MLSTLPPELLRDIIEATVPHSFHSLTHETRQKTLRSLSLVSQQFRAIAQSLLLEIVWLRSTRNAKVLHSGPGGGIRQERVTFVKQAVLSHGVPVLSPGESRNFKQLLSSVTALTVYSVPEASFSLSSLKSFTRLTSLHLSFIRWKNPCTFTLPHLRSLTVYTRDLAFLSSFLDHVALPNLRNLASSDLPVDVLQQTAFHRLLPALETLCTLDSEWTDPAYASLHAYVDKTLIISNIDNLPDLWSRRQHVPFAHLLLYGTPVINSLDDFASCIETNPPSSLKTIYLDSSLQNSDSVQSRLRHSVENLARVCSEKNVDIVFERVPRNFTIDPWILPDFVRRQKERRDRERGN